MSHISNTTNHVMIVDDDPSVRLMMGSVLDSLGLSFDEAENGEQALLLLENVLPDLLLLDVLMPGMDGFEVCTRLKETPGLSEIPIMMMTGSDDVVSIQRAFDLGVTDFITKPVPWALIGFRIIFLLQATKALSSLKKVRNGLLMPNVLPAWDHGSGKYNLTKCGFQKRCSIFFTLIHSASIPRSRHLLMQSTLVIENCY